ncbi:MAG TPA: aromatic amino acid lyase [Acidimicrobiales bacterium]|nr:aromatic amino acid lyase [Acidimicrobiales bacterium]
MLSYDFTTRGFQVTDVSEAFAQLLGATREDLIEEGDAYSRLVHPDDRARVLAEHVACLAGETIATEYRLLGRDGSVYWVYDDAVTESDAGRGRRLAGFCMDVSPRKRMEEELRASDEQFRSVAANIPGIVYRCACDEHWTMRYVSDHIEQLLGYPASDFIDNRVRTYGSIIYPADHPYVIEEVDNALMRGSAYSLEYRLVHADGTPRWIAEHGRAVLGPDRNPLWLDGVILDISRAKRAEKARDRAEEQLRQQALHDSLTGLPNRVLFRDRLVQSLATARRDSYEVAVLMLDLDRFKEINDTLGHAAGDELLKEVARRLSRVLRGSDSIARLGGDEFSIMLPRASGTDLLEIAERVTRALEEPVIVDDLPLNVDVSIGLASFPKDGDDADRLLQRADVAMYLAKTANAGFASYDASTDCHAPSRLTLIGQLRGAIDRRELVVFYQPQVAVAGGEVVGVEALVRWQHPERGLVPPDEFIPLAQETGLIKPLTHYVLEESLRQCRAWMDEGRPMRVAVNLAMRNLIDAGFPDEVAELLDFFGVPVSLLEFEITENAIVSDPWRTLAVLERLGEMGVRLSIDDFGTGYSSLGYLKRLPIDEIKIDRSFVANMASSADDAVIVRSTIDLGRNLGLQVVAEGVETADVLNRLAGLGCDLAQGFYLSKPVPAGELTGWLDTTRPVPMPSEEALVPPALATPEPITPAPATPSPEAESVPAAYAGATPERPVPTVVAARASTGPASAVVPIGTGRLSVADVVAVAVERAPVFVTSEAFERMKRSREVITQILREADPVYGVTTGVGPQRNIAVREGDQANFNRQLVLGHAVGYGEEAPESFVRAAMVVRAEGLGLGGAGARPALAEALAAALNAGVTPRVHLVGSIGQSDLAPLAEIARALIGEGPDAARLREAGLAPLELEAREGLALVSANAFSFGIAALAVDRARTALRALELSAALSFEGFLANVAALDPAVAERRPHPGLLAALAGIREPLAGGALLEKKAKARNLQDPLCFRVTPQTHASPHDALAQALRVVETELRSMSDNPLVLADEERAISNGNHDSTPVMLPIDHARLALAQAATIAVERVQKLLDSRFTDLTSGLRADPNRAEDGLAMFGHLAAAVGAEARLLAAPVSLELPTASLAEGIEDRISLASVAARRLHELGGLVIHLAAVELVCAAQAVDLRSRRSEIGAGAAAAYDAVRATQPFVGTGDAPREDIGPLVHWLETAPS